MMSRRFYARLAVFLSSIVPIFSAIGSAIPVTPVGAPKITISDDSAVVRESFQVQVTSTNMRISIPDFPREADPSTLNLIDASRGIVLQSWVMPGPVATETLSPTWSGRAVQFNFTHQTPTVSSDIHIEIQSSLMGTRHFDLVYVMTGLTWRAMYDVLLRGDLKKITSPMSIDVDGWIVLSNRSSRTFRQAMITVVGTDNEGAPPGQKWPGFLDLDEESPLADLWRYQKEPPRASNIYPLRTPVDLPGEREIMVSLVSVSRKPVNRVLVFHPDEIPTELRGRTSALPSQVIQFQNAVDYGRGRSVPPGPALIHLGSLRSSLYQEAWFKHTPAQGDIRIDMGKFPGIHARRVDKGRVPRVGGGYEQRYELLLDNHLDEEVSVLLPEQPPITFAWTVLRSNAKYELLDRRLIYQPVLPAKGQVVIQYTLSITIPDL